MHTHMLNKYLLYVFGIIVIFIYYIYITFNKLAYSLFYPTDSNTFGGYSHETIPPLNVNDISCASSIHHFSICLTLSDTLF